MNLVFCSYKMAFKPKIEAGWIISLETTNIQKYYERYILTPIIFVDLMFS